MVRGSISGWGLGSPHEEDMTKQHIMEDKDDGPNLEQAQSMVEGTKANDNRHEERV